MIRAALSVLVAGIAWSSSPAQVASVALFGPMSPASVAVTDGARTTAEGDFVLYELRRRWPEIKGAGTPGVGEVLREPQPVLHSPGIRLVSTGCGQAMLVPPRLLDARASVSRRALWPLIADAECRYGLPSGLMDSVVLAESRYNPFIVSPAGAAGLSQLMPGTAVDLGAVNRFDPSTSIQAGAHYLRQMLDSFGGNVPLALAAYNAGPAAVRRVRGIPINGETPGYVRRVLDLWTAPGIGPMSPLLSARQTAQMLGFGPATPN